MAEEVAIKIGAENKSKKCCRWCKHFSKFEIILIIILAISLSISCVLIKLFFMAPNREICYENLPTSNFSVASNFSQTKVDEECDSRECVTISHQMLTYMDSTIDPCHDFYRYACAGWEKKNNEEGISKSVISSQMSQEIDETIKGFLESDWKSPKMYTNLVLEQLRMLYHRCMDMNTVKKVGFEPAIRLLEGIGKIYVENDGLPDDLNLTRTLSKMLVIGGTPFFDVGVHVDLKNSSQLVVLISLPSYVNNIESLFPRQAGNNAKENEVNSTEEQINGNSYSYLDEIKTYINSEMDTKMNMAIEKLFKFKNETILVFTSSLSKFLDEFKNIMPKPKLLKTLNDSELDVKMSVDSLQQIFDMVNWKEILNDLFKMQFDDNTVVEVNYPKYLKDLNKLLKDFSLREINNAVLALFARDVLWNFAKEDENTMHNKRWKHCVSAIKMVSPATLSLVYAENIPKNVLDSAMKDASEIFKYLKQSLIMEITESSWISPNTKKTAIAKVSKMKANFNETLISFDDPIIKKVASISLNSDIYFENVIELSIKSREMARDLYKNNLTKHDIETCFGFLNFYDVNAYYFHVFNKIVINLGMLNLPFYSTNVPKHVIFGSLGMTIAHEMLHAFDTMGMKYDENSNFKKWTTMEEDQVYKNIAQCFINQSNSSFHQLIKSKFDLGLIRYFNFDGQFTLNENMVDSGINLAYKAYQLWAKSHKHESKLHGISLSKNKIFFLSAAQTSCTILLPHEYIINLEADEHTPEPERVNLYTMNSLEFAETYQCSSTSPMNSQNKCLIW